MYTKFMDTSIMYSKAPPQKHVRRQSKETPAWGKGSPHTKGLLRQGVSSCKCSSV